MRFALFTGFDYEASGGFGDFTQGGESVEILRSALVEAQTIRRVSFRATALDPRPDWYKIVDLEQLEVLEDGRVLELIQRTCGHPDDRQYTIEPLPPGEMIMSGRLRAPGVYCGVCDLKIG